VTKLQNRNKSGTLVNLHDNFGGPEKILQLLKKLIIFFGPVRRSKNWYCDRESSMLLADAFNRPVIHLSHGVNEVDRSLMYIPSRSPPSNTPADLKPIVLALESNHYCGVDAPPLDQWIQLPALGMSTRFGFSHAWIDRIQKGCDLTIL
jgi:hypothetical protein